MGMSPRLTIYRDKFRVPKEIQCIMLRTKGARARSLTLPTKHAIDADAVKKLNGKNARNVARFAACMNMKLACGFMAELDCSIFCLGWVGMMYLGSQESISKLGPRGS